jgi:hypothetical protein
MVQLQPHSWVSETLNLAVYFIDGELSAMRQQLFETAMRPFVDIN